MASNLIAMASTLVGMASTLVAMASNLIAIGQWIAEAPRLQLLLRPGTCSGSEVVKATCRKSSLLERVGKTKERCRCRCRGVCFVCISES